LLPGLLVVLQFIGHCFFFVKGNIKRFLKIRKGGVLGSGITLSRRDIKAGDMELSDPNVMSWGNPRSGSTLAQTEAFANEFKGALFEYQVASILSDRLAQYLNNFEDTKNVLAEDILKVSSSMMLRLRAYENWLRQYDLALIKFLPQLAAKSVESMLEKTPDLAFLKSKTSHEFKINFAEILVVGKEASASGQKMLQESDVIVRFKPQDAPEKIIAFALKLAKAQSYVNTKSGGIKSFISTYFHSFDGILDRSIAQIEHELVQFVDLSYRQMMVELLKQADNYIINKPLEVDPVNEVDDTIFFNSGSELTEQWISKYKIELPGQLPMQLRAIVHQFYYNVAQKLFSIMHVMYSKNYHQFTLCLKNLLGFGASNIYQVVAYASKKENVNDLAVSGPSNLLNTGFQYQLNQIVINSEQELMNQLYLDETKLFDKPMLEFKEDYSTNLQQSWEKSSFEIKLRTWALQIRLKPMNKFTKEGLKVNCSIKF